MTAVEYPPSMWNDDFITLLGGTCKSSFGEDERLEALIEEMRKVFHSMGEGSGSPSAYDTAWVARIAAADDSSKPHFPQLLQWLLCNQLADGSWGAQFFSSPHHSLLSTLACLLTLRLWSFKGPPLLKGVDFVNRQAWQLKEEEYYAMPPGFVILFSSMLKEAHNLGLGISHEALFVKTILAMREAQLKGVDACVLNTVPTSLLLSLEGLQEHVDWKKITHLISEDGSVAGSLASTACVFMRTGDRRCLTFITSTIENFGDHVPSIYPVDLHERLRAVETVERLSIDRHFKKEIKHALDYIYRFWKQGGIGRGRYDTIPNIEDTALGFRILRIHGYNVSSEVMENFKDEEGDFFRFHDKTQRDVQDMLSLYKCSQIAFPGETIMKEAKASAENYLQQYLQKTEHFDGLTKALAEEVKYILKYGFHRSLPRVDARTYIERFGSTDQVCLGKSLCKLPRKEKYLELAKIDFNHLQSICQKELRQIHKWWIDCGFRALKFTRERHIEIYFLVAAGMFESEYALCRMAFTKVGCLAVVLDDLYDKHASLHEIMLFNEAFARWDHNTLHGIPDHLKICFLGMYNTIKELAEQASKVQGHDMLPYFHNLWRIQLEAFTKEAEWANGSYVPFWDEYIETAKVSGAFGTTILISAHLMEQFMTDNTLSQIDYRSKALHLVLLTTRLINDTKTFKNERDCGELASAIDCYMKSNPDVSEEEALRYIYSVMQEGLIELNQQLYGPKQMPDCFKKLLVNSARLAQVIYMETDAFNKAHKHKKEMVDKCLFQRIE